MVDLEEQIFLAHHMSQFTDNPVQAEFWHALEEGIRGGKYGDRWQDKGWGNIQENEPDEMRRARGIGFRMGKRIGEGEDMDPRETAAKL